MAQPGAHPRSVCVAVEGNTEVYLPFCFQYNMKIFPLNWQA